MGLFDGFKSINARTQKELTAAEWCDKGAALDMLNRHQEALQCFDQAFAIDPTNAIAQQGKPVALKKTRKISPKKQ